MALSEYFSHIYNGINPKIIAATVIVIISVVHALGIKSGSIFQLIFTIIKVLLIIVFIIAGLIFIPEHLYFSLMPSHISWEQIISSGFAISLMYVYYSYSGWNASAYFVSELKNPAKTLPRSLIIGTVIVIFLYLFLNFTFLYVSPISDLTGKLDVGAIAATNIFGTKGGIIISGVISLLLISTISSMIFVGPRVIQTIGEDYRALRFMSVKLKNGVPLIAILIQSNISLILLFKSTFEKLLSYLGIVMNIFACLTVMGVFIHRAKNPKMERLYKTWGYPVTPILFMIFVLWNMI
jgi:APA family basic amino acid/polyamine antiporter